MRVLITGINGFTGKYLKKELENHGHTVFGLQCDITDPIAVGSEIEKLKPEAVAHLASISYVAHYSINSIYQVNLIGTHNLFQALAHYAPQVRSVLLASSANVYGNRSQDILTEDTAPAPLNDYAVSKYAMELMAHLWFDQLPVFLVRPFNYTGIGQDKKFLIPKIVTHFQQKQSIISLGNLEVWREFGDVRVIVDAYRKLLESSPKGRTINVCTGCTYSLFEVILICEKITGHKISINVDPGMMRLNEVRVLRGDNSCLKSLIGDLEAYGLEDTLRWMMQKIL